MKSKYQFDNIIWVLVTGTLASRLGTTMTVPFLSFFLHEKMGLSLYHAGLIIGAAFFAYAFGGFFGGTLSDYFGRRGLLLGSFFIYSLSFICFGLTSSFVSNLFLLGSLFFLLNIIAGICQSWFETLSQAIIADLAPVGKKVTAFGLRYTAANVGAAIGPLLGSILGLSGSMNGFYFTGSILSAYFIFLYLSFRRQPLQDQQASKLNPLTFQQTLKVIVSDKALLYFIVAGTLIFLGLVQQEALLCQIIYIKLNNLTFFSLLLTLNAVMIIALQLPLADRLSQRYDHIKMMLTGVVFLALGILGFGLSGKISSFILSEISYTLGEMLIFSYASVVVDRLAPETLRGAYFGAFGFQFLGRAVGPPLGGLLMQNFGIEIGLFVVAVITAISALFLLLVGYYRKSVENVDKASALSF